MELSALRAFAFDLADAADAVSMRHFGGPVPAVAKPDGSPVTEADQAIEAALRERIAVAYPDHAVFGEEQGGRLEKGAPTWVIDPIDGTKNFMRGVPVFATLIALVAEGDALVGVASAPALGERWDAAKGLGAHRNGQPIGVSSIADLADAHLCYGDPDLLRQIPALWAEYGRLTDQAWRMRGFGDFWMHLLVAGGAADAAFELEPELWDVAAIACIVSEAGGRITRFDGSEVLAAAAVDGPNGVLSSNGRLHERLRERLAATLTV